MEGFRVIMVLRWGSGLEPVGASVNAKPQIPARPQQPQSPQPSTLNPKLGFRAYQDPQWPFNRALMVLNRGYLGYIRG